MATEEQDVTNIDAKEIADADSTTNAIAIEDLIEQFLDRIRMGEHPSIEAYKAEHPELAAEIDELFPLVAAMEGWKAQETAACGGRNSLGGVPIARLGDFRMVREIGRGGMGIVFEAIQESLGRKVAIKILPPLDDGAGKAGERFRREAQTAASLHHSNIVPVFGIGYENGFNYIVMQLIDGCGLDKMLRARSNLTTRNSLASLTTRRPTPCVESDSMADRLSSGRSVGDEDFAVSGNPLAQRVGGGLEHRLVARLGAQAADAIDYAHSSGILHRDIKPANLLLDRTGHLWVADFGLARALEHQSLSHSGDIVGTLLYMAPERLRGKCDGRSDVYSLGITMLELLAGKPVFEPRDTGALIERIMRGFQGREDALKIQLPIDLKTILDKSVALDPNDRYATAGEMAEDLRAFLDDRPIRARQPTRVEQFLRVCRRNPVVTGLSASLIGLLVLTVILTTTGLIQQRRMRTRTQATLNTSLSALDTIYSKFAGPSNEAAESLASGAVLSDEAALMLTELLTVYDELASQGGDSSQLEREALNAQLRVAEIQTRLGAFANAGEYYGRAVSGMNQLSFVSQEEERSWQLKNGRALLGWAAVVDLLGEPDRALELRSQSRNTFERLNQRWPDDAEVLLGIAKTFYLDGCLATRSFSNVEGRFLRLAPPRGRPREELGRGYGLGGMLREAFGPPRPDGPRPDGPRPDGPRHGGAGPGGAGRGFVPPKFALEDSQSKDQQAAAMDPTAASRAAALKRAIHYLTLASDAGGSQPLQQEIVLVRALSLRELAGTSTDSPEGSMQQLEQAIELLQGLLDANGSLPEYSLQLARTLMQAVQATTGRNLDDLRRNVTFLERAVSMLTTLHSRQPQVPEYTATLAQVSELLALFSIELADRESGENRNQIFSRAEDLVRSATELQNQLVTRFPDSAIEQLWSLRYRTTFAFIASGRRDPRVTEDDLKDIVRQLEELGSHEEVREAAEGLILQITENNREKHPPRRNGDY